MKRISLVVVAVLGILATGNAQFEINANGVARLETNGTQDWSVTMYTHTNLSLSKNYMVEYGTSDICKFYVRGDGYIWARGSVINSDARFKKDIADVTDYSRIFSLTAKTYTYDDDYSDLSAELYEQEANRKQYGFIAQDMVKIFPEMVMEDEDGYMSINYTSLVPLLVEVVKDHRSTIEILERNIETLEESIIELQEQLEKLSTKQTTDRQLKSDINEDIATATLADCRPNPFTAQTTIAFEIPTETQHAILQVHNLQGKTIRSYPIHKRGKSELTIQGAALEAGLYLYSLILDNKLIDTKRMLLTE